MKTPKTTGTTPTENLVTTSGGTEDNRQAVCDELNNEWELAELERESARLRDALETIAAQSSGDPFSTKLSDCMAAIASVALSNIN